MKLHAILRSLRLARFLRAFLGLLLTVIGFAVRAEPAAVPAPLPRLAISPVIPPGADDGLDLGRTFADLLAAHLSSSDSWTLVERAQLAIIEDEWLLKGSDLAGRAASLRIGALSRADLVLECHVSGSAVENPWCKITVVETARAEVLAEETVPLSTRPSGPWYRSPPAQDVEGLAGAARKALGQACASLAAWRGRPVAALLFSAGPDTVSSEMEPFLERLSAAAESGGFRWVSLIPGQAAEAEGLLNLLGYTDSSLSPWKAAADLYLWVETGGGGRLKFCSWRPGFTVRRTPMDDASPAAIAAVLEVLRADLTAGETGESDASRLAVAQGFLREARARWEELGLGDKSLRQTPEIGIWPRPDAGQRPKLLRIRTLLDAAGFFALEDAEIQELRAVWDIYLSSDKEKLLALQHFCAMADRFWVRPDQSVDWRLLTESFGSRSIPAGFQRRRIATDLNVLLTFPDEMLTPFGPLLERWVYDMLSPWDERSLELLKKIWPLAARALGRKVHQAVSDDATDLYTSVRFGQPSWHDEIAALLDANARWTEQPEPEPKLHPRLKPTERAGLAVPPRTPKIYHRRIQKALSGEGWEAVELLDDGTTRRSPSDPPASNVPPLPGPSSPRMTAPQEPVAMARPRPPRELPPLLVAGRAGNWDEVDRLLDAGADLHTPSGRLDESKGKITCGEELLGLAVFSRRYALATRLLEAGVKPGSSRNDSLLAPLIFRVEMLSEAELALIGRLIGAGAGLPDSDFDDPYVRLFDQRERWSGPDAATGAGNQPRHSGRTGPSSANPWDKQQLATLKRLVDLDLRTSAGRRFIDRADEEGRTPLIRAILLDWAEGTQALLGAGASLNLGSYQGRSAHRLLAERPELARRLGAGTDGDAPVGTEPDGPEIVAALAQGDLERLARSAITPRILSYRDPKQWTVLHHALNRKAEAYALRLIEAGAPLDALSGGGQTPLAFAAAGRLDAAVTAMLAAGAPVNLRGGDGPTPLFQAVYSQNPGMVKRLLAAGADPAVQVDAEHATAVLAAAGLPDNVAILEVLRAAGADFQVRCVHDETLLDWALTRNAPQNIAYLLAQGVHWSSASPLVRATKLGNDSMVRTLLDCGIWDEAALPLADSPKIAALLEDAAVRRGSKVLDDLELWPAICADRVNGRRRAEEHLAKGGNVNFARSDGWGYLPIERALQAMNPDLVRFLLERGAIPRVHREGQPNLLPPSLELLVAPLWVTQPRRNNPPPGISPAEATLEAWDAYAADMIGLIARRWPDPAYSRMYPWLVRAHQPRAIAALRAAGVIEPPAEPEPADAAGVAKP